ncbi:MAG TPA: sulfatase [Flavisolibacter sp.]|nr:sulfatase [Flavisolibacter sp.]
MRKLFLGFFCSLSMLQSYAQKRPNIIIFLVDDMGWLDTSVPFGDSVYPLNKRYHTPNMERLAKEGMKFTNAYATPVCTPTRISMITGMNAAHHGVTNWTSPRKNNNTDNGDQQFFPASWNINGLSNVKGVEHTINATTYPQLLKDAGYFTIHVGKAHWGPMGTPGSNPYNLGFMVNVAGHAAGHPQNYLGTENYGNVSGKASVQAVPDLEEYFGTDTFLTEALTLEAIKSLEAPVKNKQPFYLNMAHYAVHDPIQADKRYFQKYLDAGADTIEAKYASLIEGMDKSLGDLMNYLQKKEIDKNTIIIFMSDNGGLSYVPPRGGEMHTQNWPLKAGKGSVYEGGIREPMIVKWPSVVKPNSVARQYVMIEDFFPTVLEMAGVKNYKTIQQVDGKSFLSVLKNPSLKNEQRILVWHFPNKWQPKDGPGINYKSAIRRGAWKLIYYMRDGSKELYNLQLDVGETKNLAAQYPEKVKALSSLLSQQLRKWKAPMPVVKNTGRPAALPDEENGSF